MLLSAVSWSAVCSGDAEFSEQIGTAAASSAAMAGSFDPIPTEERLRRRDCIGLGSGAMQGVGLTRACRPVRQHASVDPALGRVDELGTAQVNFI